MQQTCVGVPAAGQTLLRRQKKLQHVSSKPKLHYFKDGMRAEQMPSSWRRGDTSQLSLALQQCGACQEAMGSSRAFIAPCSCTCQLPIQPGIVDAGPSRQQV